MIVFDNSSEMASSLLILTGQKLTSWAVLSLSFSEKNGKDKHQDHADLKDCG
jgi:hypothetical protein